MGSVPQFSMLTVSAEKLRDYCLSPTHPRGRHKARVFKSRLGFGPDDAKRLALILAEAVDLRRNEMMPGEIDAFGERYLLDVPITTEMGSAVIRTAWIVRAGEDVLRFVSCYVL